jgi:hypothetical protein
VSLAALEGLYRWQVVDAYWPELRGLNAPEDLVADGRRTVLIMGDSFTASPGSYVGILKQTFPRLRIINGGVSGTGVIQTELMAPRRFHVFQPSIFIYQSYVGNDLLDIRYPVNWAALSVGRNLYWLVANQLRSISYVNYRLGQIGQAGHRGAGPAAGPAGSPGPAARTTEAFARERYDARVKLYVMADPSLVEDSILVTARRQRDYDTHLGGVGRLLAHCKPERCQAYLLVIPHASQVDVGYLSRMRRLGATFTEPERLRAAEYPFLVGIRSKFATWPHVHVLNPLPVLREANQKAPVYFANDEHLNSVGQETIAAFLARELDLRRSTTGQ